jgi:DNA-binding IclR family transcriptional regulator
MPAIPDTRMQRRQALALAIESEFREMPGMRLTLGQVRRLWNLSAEDAARMMSELVDAGRLELDESGRYCRCGESGD